MKKFFAITVPLSVIVLALIQTTSCEKYILPELDFEPDTLIFKPIADSAAVEISANVSWSCTTDDDETWYSVSPEEGDENGLIIVTVEENSSPTKREATVEIACEIITKSLLIIQQGTE